MRKCSSLLFLIMISTSIFAQDSENLDDQLKSIVKSEPFNFAMLFQSTFRYSLENDGFQGGRTFQIPQGRLDFSGNLDEGYFYRLHLNMVTEPNLLDAYIGYKHNDQLILTLGRQKPLQSPDFIPAPQATDFMARARITGFLVQFREFGLSARGSKGDWTYFAGIFNGTSSSYNLGNNFYGVGRVQFTITDLGPGFLKLGLHGAHGSGTDERSSITGGTYVVNDRSIIGFDAHYQTDKWKLKGEYIQGWYEDVLILNGLSNRDDLIRGYYINGSYNVTEDFKFAGRFQHWMRDGSEANYQSTVGMIYEATSLVSFRVNVDVYTPVNGDRQAGIGAMMQVYF